MATKHIYISREAITSTNTTTTSTNTITANIIIYPSYAYLYHYFSYTMYRIQKWSTNLVRASRRSKRRHGVGRGCRPAGGAPEQGAGLWGGAPEQDVGGRNVKQGTGGRERIDGASSSLHLPPLSLFPPPPSLLLLTFSLGPAMGRHRTSQGTALGAVQGPPGGRAFPWRAGPG